MMVSERMLRQMKALKMSDEAIAELVGCNFKVIQKLRRHFEIGGMRPHFSSPHKGKPTIVEMSDGWPEVMPPDVRDRVWARYFRKLGRNHSDGEVRVKPMDALRIQPDRSHLHGLGATSLEF